MIQKKTGLGLITTLITLLLLIQPAVAIQKALAGVVDWHKPYIGIPRSDLAIAFPSTNGVKQKAYVATQSNVLAALNFEINSTSQEQIAWRLQLDKDDDQILDFVVNGQSIIVLSGKDQVIARSLSSSTGHIIWETPLYLSAEGPTKPLIEVLDNGDVFVVLGGKHVSRLAAKSGVKVKAWDYEVGISDTSTIVKVASVGNTIHLINLVSSFTGYTVSHTTLNLPSDSLITETQHLDISISSPSDMILTTDSTSSTPSTKLHWYDSSSRQISSVLLPSEASSSSKKKPTKLSRAKDFVDGAKIKYKGIKDVGLASKGYLLGIKEDGSADILSSKLSEGAEAFWHFDNEGTGARSEPIWNGFVDAQGGAYITRIFWSHALGLANLHSYSIDHKDGYVYTGSTFTFDTMENGVILNAAVQITPAEPIINRFSAFVSTSTGAIQAWYEGEQLWTREESLAEIQAMKLLELPEKAVEDVKELLADEGFVARTTRHIGELKAFPLYIARFIGRFTGGSYVKALSSTPLKSDALFRDQFGFQKLALAATSTGKLFAIDSAHGNTVWSKNLAISVSAESQLEVLSMWNVRDVSELGNPVVAIVAVKKTSRGSHTVAYHVDPFTGEVELQKDEKKTPFPAAGKELFSGAPVQTFPLPVHHCTTKIRAMAVVDSDFNVHLFPFCKKIEAGFANISSLVHFSTTDLKTNTLTGHAASSNPIADGVFPSYSTWSLPLGPDTIIKQIVSPTGGPISSFGRVLGDRSTLYKYLNPHLLALSTVDTSSGSGTITVLDSTNGMIVYQATVDTIDVKRGIEVVMTENWLVYVFDEAGDLEVGKKGHRLVSVELYETSKSQSSDTSSFAGEVEVEALSKSFVFPIGIRSPSFTSSLHGISSKDLLYINDRGQIATVPRRMLDPRRPIGKPSKAEKEEMLVPYDPTLPVDPRLTISHSNDLVGIKTITTTPALLESTSLIVSYGLDLFGSRVQPSGSFDLLSDAFNKPQLLLTISALTVGILIVRPMVYRKTMKGRWY